MLLGVSLCACTGNKPDDGADANKGASAATSQPAKPEPADPGKPEPTDPEPTPVEPFTPSTPVGPITINAPAFDCPALPTSITGVSAEIARVLRQLACEPALFALTSDELGKKLALPTGVTVHFSGPGAVAVEITDMPPVTELAAALGIDEPVARLQWVAYHDQWWLGSNPKTGELDRYGPGVINIQVLHDADESDPPGKVVPLTAEMPAVSGYITVGMPNGVVQPGPDPEALTQLATAMRILAAKPAMLAEAPETVVDQLGLAGERFEIARTSLHGAGPTIHGISIQPMRTVIPADKLAEALGLVDARVVSVNREHDVWNIEAGSSKGSIPWNAVVLDIDVNPASKDDKATTLVGATVEFISILPAS
jgi:hypothetical protein